jgi:thiol-disulfide isomerase/thioredoxin
MNESYIFIRAIWALIIIASALSIYKLANHFILYRAQKNNPLDARETLLTRQGIPSILYFTTPECVACKAVQRPALQSLQECLGDALQVIEVDAKERPELAKSWGVLSVPTTFIIDEQGQLRHVNHGVTRVEKLMQQLQGIHSTSA